MEDNKNLNSTDVFKSGSDGSPLGNLEDKFNKLSNDQKKDALKEVFFSAEDARNAASRTVKILKRIYKLIKECANENCSRLTYNFNDVLADVIIDIASTLKLSGYKVEADFRMIGGDEGDSYTLNTVCLAKKNQIFDYANLKISW